MNKEELDNYRKNFYIKLEQTLQERKTISIEDYYVTLAKTIKEFKIDEKTSKKVYVYIGSYIKDENIFTKTENEYLTYDNNPKITHKIYKNIETDDIYKIDIKKCKKFEKNNKILFPIIDLYNIQEYNKQFEKIKLQYFKNLLYNKQKDSYKLVKKINEQE